MKKLEWFDRSFAFGISPGMLPFLLERLQGTVVRLHHKVAAEADEVLSYQPGGKWSIKQHIGHLAEVDEIALRRIDEIIGGMSPMTPAVFEPKADYNSQPVAGVLESFAARRRANLDRYARLSDEECLRQSLHPRLKVLMTPVDLAYFDAEHDDHHLVKINELLSGRREPGR